MIYINDKVNIRLNVLLIKWVQFHDDADWFFKSYKKFFEYEVLCYALLLSVLYILLLEIISIYIYIY